jgi:hypothetical protein
MALLFIVYWLRFFHGDVAHFLPRYGTVAGCLQPLVMLRQTLRLQRQLLAAEVTCPVMEGFQAKGYELSRGYCMGQL